MSCSIVRYEIVPRFKAGDLDAGVLEGAAAVPEAAEGDVHAARAQAAPRRARPS